MRKSNLLILAIMFCYGFIVSSCETVEDNPTDNPQPVDTEFDYDFDLSTDGGTVRVALNENFFTKISAVEDADDWVKLVDYDFTTLEDIVDEETGLTVLPAGSNYLVLNLKYDAIDYETAESDEREATITLKTESGQSITLHIRQGHPYDDTYFYPEYPYGDGSLLVLPYYKGSDGADDPFIPNEEQKKFLTDWENVKNVTLYYNHGATTQVPTPWNLQNSQIAIQSSIGSDVLKADGWEMAFSTIGYDNPGRNYFGLYNRELGILRIFFYCDKDVTGTGNHFYFHVQMGDQRNRESFYGTLPFGVPMNHHSTKLTINADEKVYTQALTPYHILNDKTLVPDSWNCFDIDMSSYTEHPFTSNKNDRITMRPYFVDQSSVSLESALTAKIDGSMNIFKEVAHQGMANRGFAANLAEFIKFGKDGSSAVKDVAVVIGKAWAGDYAGALAGIGNAVTSVKAAVKTGKETFAQEDWVEKVEGSEMKGTFDLNLKGAIDTKGFTTTTGKPSAIPVYHVTSNLIQPDTHLGEGVWNLEGDPQLLVASDMVYNPMPLTQRPFRLDEHLRERTGLLEMFDDFLTWKDAVKLSQHLTTIPGSLSAFEDMYDIIKSGNQILIDEDYYKANYLYCYQDGLIQMRTNSGSSYATCVPVILDPASVKVKINPNIFPNPTNIEVNAYYGFFTDDENLNIPQWRSALGLDCFIDKTTRPAVSSRPVIFSKFFTDVKGSTGDYMSAEIGNKSDKPLFSYRGFFLKGAGKEFRMNPWLSNHFTNYKFNDYWAFYNTYAFFNGTTERQKESSSNDYWKTMQSFRFFEGINNYNETLQRKCYVVVTLKFESNGKTYIFSRRYLPNIKLASFVDNLEDWYDYYTQLKGNGSKAADGIKYPLFQDQLRVLFSLFDSVSANGERIPSKVKSAVPIN